MSKKLFVRAFLMLFCLLLIIGCGASGGSSSGAMKQSTEAAYPTSEETVSDTSGAKSRGRDTGAENSDYSDAELLSSSTESKSSFDNVPESSGLSAGFVDDNKQYNYFVKFLKEYRQYVQIYEVDISERLKLQFTDKEGDSIANCSVEIKGARGNLLYKGKTFADGSLLFFPSMINDNSSTYRVTAQYENMQKTYTLDRYGKREVELSFNDYTRKEIKNVPLDIVFIFDTTGSMEEEIERLKDTIEIIHMNVSSFKSRPVIRFGMVLYKDIGDEYRTKVIQLTDDLEKFKKELDKVSAFGGGDIPEDLQQALDNALNKLNWNENGIRMSFVITDAPPHLDYGQNFTYLNAMEKAQKEAIKIFTIGTGGLPLQGEYILRQISQFTYANYIFLHYGERGESEGGKVGSVSHHTGGNYQVSSLEALIIRLTKKELSFLTDQPLVDDEEFFQAQKNTDESNKDILLELFNKAISQLIDYSTFYIEQGTAASVLPISPREEKLTTQAEYLTELMLFSLMTRSGFKVIDRSNIQKIIQEQKFQKSDLFDSDTAVKVGELVGAQVLIISDLYKLNENTYEIFAKMVRVETGEILSVTKMKIDENLIE